MTSERRTCPGCYELRSTLDRVSRFDDVTPICRMCSVREVAATDRGAQLTAPGVALGAALPPREIRVISLPLDLEVPVQVLRVTGDVPHFQRALGATWLEAIPVLAPDGEQYTQRLHVWCDEEYRRKRLPYNVRATVLVQRTIPGGRIMGEALVCATDMAGDMASVPEFAIDDIAGLLRGSFGPTYGLLEDFTTTGGNNPPDPDTRFF